MCGITCVLSKKNDNIIQFIYNSLNLLQNRGYDSVGIAYFLNNSNTIESKKYASSEVVDSLVLLKDNIEELNANIAMGHTRWATHGPKTELNAHPHHSTNKRFYICHNGIIENYKKIKKMLEKEKYTFYSQTDSEVIANLIDFNYNKINNIEQAINKALTYMEGTYGLSILSTLEPEKIYLVRKGSPLIIAENDNMIVATSEISGFVNNFNHYMNIESGKIVCCTKDGFTCINKLKKIYIDQTFFETTPHPYPHWTLKEIHEQPESLLRVLNNGARINNDVIKLGGLEILKDKLHTLRTIILIGCGTSLNACMCAKYYFQKYANLNTILCIDGAEFTVNDIPKDGCTLIVLCSQSGETKDVHRCIKIGREKGIVCVGIINVVNSIISREVDCGIYINSLRENGVASTKSFTSMILSLFLFSLWINQETKGEHIKYVIDDIRQISYQCCILLKNISVDKNILIRLNKPSLFVLGKGKMEAISREGALKIKEISYIHAEGCSGSALKHGPFALLTEGFPIILLIDEENRTKMLNVYEEVKSRGAFVYIITEIRDLSLENQDIFLVENNNNCKEILFVVVLQYIAYQLSILNNINPDKPRNLAKVVTVE
jgi:glutamine---fructose-6-phosphate transaminase (isomerizing)